MNPAAFDHALDLIEQKRYKEAEPILLDLHDRDPMNARINFSLGLVYDDADEVELSLAHLRRAAEVAKKKSIVFEELAQILIRAGEYDEALEAARKAVKLDPNVGASYKSLGDAYAKLQRPVLARQAFQKAIKLEPEFPAAYLALHLLEKSLGDKEKAQEYLNKAREVSPKNPSVLYQEAIAAKHKEKPENLDTIEEVLGDEEKEFKRNQRAHLHYAAAKIYDDLGEMDNAFRHFEAGRKFLYSPYNSKRRRWQIDAFKEFFNKEFFEARKEVGLESAKPVFVFGMPRSGTTLTEQIIGRHPKAVGAGELTYFHSEMVKLRDGAKVTPEFFKNVLAMDPKAFRRAGKGYLSLLDSIGGKAARVVDKMPHNFENLWMMALLFPNASFIHLNRKPIDNCISIYTTPLRDGHNYASSQKNLGEYYCMYRELMDHWVEVLPVKIREQSYEAMVEDQERESRALIDHVGLPWDDACLEFYKGDRQVTTFSIDQVRRPIYKSSVNRWKRYEAQVSELVEALGSYGPKKD